MVAEVSVGQVQYTDSDTGVQELPSQSGVIGDYMARNHYEWGSTSFAINNTSEEPFDGANVSVVTIGCTLVYWVNEWTVCKVGGHPDVPDPDPMDRNWVLLDAFCSTAMQSLGPSGSDVVYRISGTYVYTKRKAGKTVYDDTVYPRAPWLREGYASRRVPAANITRGLMDITGSGSQAQVFSSQQGTPVPGFTADSGQGIITPPGFVPKG